MQQKVLKSKIRVLFLYRFNIFPPKFGSARRTYDIIKHLSEKYRITLLSLLTGNLFQKSDLPINVYSISFPTYFSYFNPFYLFNIIKVIKREKPEWIVSETLLLGPYALFIKLFYGIRYILDEQNIEYIRLRQFSYGRVIWPIIKLLEKIICKFSYKVLCVSENDRCFLISMGIKKEKICIINNGIDQGIFYPNIMNTNKIRNKIGIEGDEKIILFFGPLDYEPNKNAIYIIEKEIMPIVKNNISNVKFVIVGRNPPLTKNNDIIYTGEVDHIEDYINLSDVVICPLEKGGGTRIKILEAIACGKQVVSTSIGAEGLITPDMSSNLSINDNWDDFSKQIINILDKPRKSEIPKNFLERYSWDNIIKKFDDEIFSSYPD